MEIVRRWQDVPAALRGAVLAIGNFDGVHRGHQALLDKTKAAARDAECPAGVMLFEPHPRNFFQPQRPIFELTPLPRKLDLLAMYGMDLAVVVDFNAEFAALSAEAFVKKVLIGALETRRAIVGYDFLFGKGRQGNPQILSKLGNAGGMAVSVVEPVGAAGETFSSTRVRELLAEGDPRGAAEMLGYWWLIEGDVAGGAGRGRRLGFPTANIALAQSQALHHGIYAVRVYVDGLRHHGAAYLGTRPTFDAGPPVLEIFLLNYEGDLYGKTLEVELIDFVREDARFRHADSLVEQMHADCEQARRILECIDSHDPMLRYPLGRTIHERHTAAAHESKSKSGMP